MEKGAGSNFSFQTRRVGFVIGDGSLIVTAEHCIDDFRKPAAHSSSRRLFAISPYYGDIFPVEIVAHDAVEDVAILRASWPTHPAFALAEPNDLQLGDTTSIPSIPPIRHDKRHINTHFLLEHLTVDQIDLQKPDKAILFTQDGLIEAGWSGSPILLQASQKVTGVMCQIRWHKETRALFFKKTIHRAAGSHIQSILKLVRGHHLHEPALAVPPAVSPDILDSEAVFGHIQSAFNALITHDLSAALTQMQQAAESRPDSAYLHLWLAHMASAQKNRPEDERETLQTLLESALDSALTLAPEDPHILAVYGSSAKKRGKPDLARQHTQAALDQDPNNALALYTQLLLNAHDPNQAIAYGRRLTAIEPNNTMAWFYTSMALLNTGRPEEALKAAQQTVATDPNGLIRTPLARALAALDRIDEAQLEFEFMTEKCTCANCWFRYASFVLNHQPDQAEAAQQALNTAKTAKKRNGLTDRKLEQLQIQIYKHTDPNQAQSLLQARLETDPNEADSWWRLADILRTKNQHTAAAEAAHKAVNLDPNNIYYPRLANCLAKTGDLAGAQGVYDTMLEQHPERSRYWYFYAEYLLDSNQPDQASEALDRIDTTARQSWKVSSKERDDLRRKITQSQQEAIEP
ncbi:MAG: tetratricopeptide repeat protein [Planctomycetes bacterium]|nr:tetratricopeptide repeat protein [Planctomycetota bacterium]